MNAITLNAQAQENTSTQANNTKEEVNMNKVAITRKPITDADGRFNLDYMKEIRHYKSMLHEAEIKIDKINTEKAVLLNDILKKYKDYLGGETYWFESDKEKYFEKIKNYNAMIDNKKAQEEIIKEAKSKLAEYDY